MHVILHLVCVSCICLLIGLHIFTAKSHTANVQLMTRKAHQWGDETKGGERIGISRDGHIPLVKGKRSECRQDREMGLWQGRWRGMSPQEHQTQPWQLETDAQIAVVSHAHTQMYIHFSFPLKSARKVKFQTSLCELFYSDSGTCCSRWSHDSIWCHMQINLYWFQLL